MMRIFGHFRRMCATMRATSTSAPSLPATFARTLTRQQNVPAAKYIERQIAIFLVIAVVEAALLHAVKRDVGVVEIEHDLARRTLMRLEKYIDHQRIDLGAVAIDLVIGRGVSQAD